MANILLLATVVAVTVSCFTTFVDGYMSSAFLLPSHMMKPRVLRDPFQDDPTVIQDGVSEESPFKQQPLYSTGKVIHVSQSLGENSASKLPAKAPGSNLRDLLAKKLLAEQGFED